MVVPIATPAQAAGSVIQTAETAIASASMSTVGGADTPTSTSERASAVVERRSASMLPKQRQPTSTPRARATVRAAANVTAKDAAITANKVGRRPINSARPVIPSNGAIAMEVHRAIRCGKPIAIRKGLDR